MSADPFDACPDDASPFLLDAMRAAYSGKEWPEPVAVFHLRVLMGRRRTNRMKASEWPTVRALQAEWGWLTRTGKPAVDRVAAFLTRTKEVTTDDGRTVTVLHWQDAHRFASLEELRGDRMLGANRDTPETEADGKPTGSRREADGKPTADTGERQESECEADGKPTGSRREADGKPTPRASLPRASTEPPSTVHPSEPIYAASGVTGQGSLFGLKDEPPAAPPEPSPPVAPDPPPVEAPKATRRKPRKCPGYAEAIAVWDDEHRAAYGRAYGWAFDGKEREGDRVKAWLARMLVKTEEDVPAALARLRRLIRRYFAATNAGQVFPYEEPANVTRFAATIQRWERDDDSGAPVGAGAAPQDPRFLSTVTGWLVNGGMDELRAREEEHHDHSTG